MIVYYQKAKKHHSSSSVGFCFFLFLQGDTEEWFIRSVVFNPYTDPRCVTSSNLSLIFEFYLSSFFWLRTRITFAFWMKGRVGTFSSLANTGLLVLIYYSLRCSRSVSSCLYFLLMRLFSIASILIFFY